MPPKDALSGSARTTALAVVAGLALSVSSARADDGCQGADMVFRADAAGAAAAFPDMPGGSCQTTRNRAGETGFACHWAHDYRSESAASAFRALTQRFDRCFGAESLMPADRKVNHPDSYDLRRYRLNGQVVAVSQKDKAALDRTFVFVRVAPAGE